MRNQPAHVDGNAATLVEEEVESGGSEPIGSFQVRFSADDLC